MKPKKEYQLIIGRHLSLAKTEIDEIPLRIESLEMNAVMIFLTREEKTNDY